MRVEVKKVSTEADMVVETPTKRAEFETINAVERAESTTLHKDSLADEPIHGEANVWVT